MTFNLFFKVDKFVITSKEKYVVPVSNRNYVYANFEFSGEWNTLDTASKFAIFSNDIDSIRVPLEEEKCRIPKEILEVQGQVDVGVIAGDMAVSTIARFTVGDSIYQETEPPEIADPSYNYVLTPASNQTMFIRFFDGEFQFFAEGEWKAISSSIGGGGTSDLLWKPNIEDGVISWIKSSSTTPPSPQNIQGSKGNNGDPGFNGWSPIFAVITDGDRDVLRVIDWTGGAGTKPPINVYVGPTGYVDVAAQGVNIRGGSGSQGLSGFDGWTPILSVATDGERRVHRVVDWTGGTGTKPISNVYVGATGFVSAIGQAIDIRGSKGMDGEGVGGQIKKPMGRGILFLGDSQMQAAYILRTVTSIKSDNIGIVTITFSTNPGYLPGERIRIINAAPLGFNGEFKVLSVVNADPLFTCTIENTAVPPNTTAIKDWASPGGPAVAQQLHVGINFLHVGMTLADGHIPIPQIWALTSTSLADWGSRLSTYVYPTGVEYVCIALGGNDTGAGAEIVIERYRKIIDDLLLHGKKPICCKIYPRNEAISTSGNVTIITVNAWLEEYCSIRNIPVIDFHTPLLTSGGVPDATLYSDTLHVNNTGHASLGVALGEALKKIFAKTDMLPISSIQNVASGTNSLDDPLITKIPVASTQSGVTGYYGSETIVNVGGGTAISSIEAREDGYGNDIKVVGTVSSITFTTSRAQTITVPTYSVVFPIFALSVDSTNAATLSCSWTCSRNGATARTITLTPAITPVGNTVVRGEPVFLQAGDTLSGVSVIAKINGASGVTTARFGRVMVRIMSYDDWRALQTMTESAQVYVLPAPTETVRGGITAKIKTTETSEVAYDPITQRLFSSAAPAGQVAFNSITGQPRDNVALAAIINDLYDQFRSIDLAIDALNGDTLDSLVLQLDLLNGEVI